MSPAYSTESDSESDGGMQIDGSPLPSNLDEDPQQPLDFGQPALSVEPEFVHRAPDPLTTIYNQTGQGLVMELPTEYEKDIRMRSHLRDEKHAALCVLMDREMLVTYALTANETIPQTRRRFMAKYLAPSDPERAEKLYAPCLYIADDGNGREASLVRGSYKEVIGGIEDHGWRKPAHLRRMENEAKTGSRSASRSVSGANSPRQVSGVRLGSGSRRSSSRRAEDGDGDEEL